MKSLNHKPEASKVLKKTTDLFLKEVSVFIFFLMCLQFCNISFAKNDPPVQKIEGIYTGFLLNSGVPQISMTSNLDQSGNVTEISEGMVNNVRPETTGTGSWRKSTKGGVDIVEVIYMSGRFCTVIGQDTCRVVLGIQGNTDKNGLLVGSVSNLTIKGLHPDSVSIDVSPFTSFTVELQKQSFDDMLIAH